MEQNLTDSGWRGSYDGWLQAASDALLESGVDAVRIMPLAKKLNLSRTSFYWFFRDREQLLDALVTKWRDKNTGNLIRRSEAYAESLVEATLNVFDCWLNQDLFDSSFEFAIRSWGLQSGKIATEVKQADEFRLDALKNMFARFGRDDASADVRARTLYLVQIGYISMQTQEPPSVRMKRMADYVEIFTGTRPENRDMNRFFARHDFSSGEQL